MKVIKSELFYTGGGIWCAEGELEDGTFFAGGDNESFVIYKPSVFQYIEEHKDEYMGDDTSLVDVCGLTGDEYVERYTDDADGENAAETFDMWLQIYNQHSDSECVDKKWLLDDLYEYFKTEKEVVVNIDLTLKELGVINELLADKSYLPEVNDIFCKVNEIYCNECENARE